MEISDNDYHTSFFKPVNQKARANRNMVLWLVAIWVIAIFGFQIALKILEEPTPEPEYELFQSVWESIKSGSYTPDEMNVFAKSTLQVLGKINLAPDERASLNDAFSWSVYSVVPDSLQSNFVKHVQEFENLKATIENISDAKYIEAKGDLSEFISSSIDLSLQDVRSKIAPLEIISEDIASVDEKTMSVLPSIMEKYLIHNQSVLTDTKFLGFPFHYFYTAVFLLILFVGLCLGYCIRTDKLNIKYNIED